MTTISKEQRDAAKALIREALRFAVWASGEGIGPDPLSDEADPDVMLMDYTTATSDEDWDTLADRLPALLDALDAAEKAEPVAWMYPDGRAGAAVTMDRKVACDAFPGIASPIPLYTRPPATREGWKLVPVGPLADVLDAISDVVEQMDDAGFSRSAIDLVPLRNARMALVRALAAAPEAK